MIICRTKTYPILFVELTGAFFVQIVRRCFLQGKIRLSGATSLVISYLRFQHCFKVEFFTDIVFPDVFLNLLEYLR